ncbi:uroporphyrinogen-III C-methyltransferase [Candidatus Albibeggiatoa sp. nov. NOAA]|uniref:uroporphyrinogen-III C-methyltransferase n=1 Tax=Candidatus Albibeggiatoa sp. nov. NOAA TaxID=3162724 RepID=UPI0033002150|nr:uroporphyrinogen-III C-methyltransferase [Thiotrichaceae bacterium]
MANDPIIPLSQMPNPTGRLYSHHDEDGNVSYSTEPPNAQAKSTQEKPTIKKKRRGWATARRFFSFLLVISALGLSFYVFKQMSHIGEQVGQQVTLVSTSQHSGIKAAQANDASEQLIAENNSQLKVLQQLIQDVTDKQQSLEQQVSSLNAEQTKAKEAAQAQTVSQDTALKTAVTSIEQHLETVKQDIQQVQNDNILASQDWTLSEIRYLFNLAQHRLQFMQDSHTALQVLNAAKEKLQNWAQPQLAKPLVAQIEQDVATLQALQALDTTTIAKQLSSYIDQVPELNLVKAATPPAETSETVDKQPLEIMSILESWGDVTSVVWSEMKQLVTITHNENVDAGLLDDSQIFFVQESLRLKLETARLALLKSDFQTFQITTKEATAWLTQYYDQNAIQVVEMQLALQKLRKLDFSVDYPSMSQALDILKRVKAQWLEHVAN